jgi:hypothetical protein
MKNNIPPLDADTIVEDVNENMCDIFTENSNVEEMSTEPIPESEDTSTTANTSRNSETRRKRKGGKIQALFQLLALEEGKTEQLEKGVQQKSIMSTQEDYSFSMSLLPHLRDTPKRRKLAVQLALQQVSFEEESGESDRTEWRSGSSYYSSSTVPTPSSLYGMQSSGSEHTLQTTYSTIQPSQKYKEPSPFVQLAEFMKFGKYK